MLCRKFKLIPIKFGFLMHFKSYIALVEECFVVNLIHPVYMCVCVCVCVLLFDDLVQANG